jgi:hypothetical protein
MGLFPSLANWAQPSNPDNVGLNALGNGGLLISMFLTAIIIHGLFHTTTRICHAGFVVAAPFRS